jgi:multiple sugar transport system substrate-binding protein
LEAVSNAAGGDYLMEMLRGPSMTGKATERKTWYKASMLWSASARSKNPEAAVAWINWYANSPEAGNIEKAERGIPPSAELLAAVEPNLSPAQKAVAQYIADIKPEVANTPIAPPPGGGTIPEILSRHGIDVLFGRASSAEGAQKFVDELKSNLQV